MPSVPSRSHGDIGSRLGTGPKGSAGAAGEVRHRVRVPLPRAARGRLWLARTRARLDPVSIHRRRLGRAARPRMAPGRVAPATSNRLTSESNVVRTAGPVGTG